MQLEPASVHSGEGRTELKKKQSSSSISHISIYIPVAEHGATWLPTSRIRRGKISIFLQIQL